ncbi:hypothetical protein [Pseudomonas putida]|uniref:hypothetical protein n=1 Tax=Pseudomonas putida TaxID=303 RepID=UPI003F8B5AF4
MSTPFSNIWFSALATVVTAWVCYVNIDQLDEHWAAVIYLVVLALNTLCLLWSRRGASTDATDQRDNQNLTRQVE